MARADILPSLVQSANRNDMVSFRKSVESLIAEERAKKHTILADRLAATISGNGNKNSTAIRPNGQANDFVFEIVPQKQFDDLIIEDQTLKIFLSNLQNREAPF